MLSSFLDIGTVSVLATRGLLMAPIDPGLVAGLLVVVVIFLAAVDVLKIGIFRFVGLHTR